MENMIRTNTELENYLRTNRGSQILLIPPMRLYDNGLVYSIVSLSFETEFMTGSNFNGDIWKLDCNRYSLTRNALDKIATAAGIKFYNSRMLSREVDENGRAIYIKHQIQYELLCTDDSCRSSSATGEYNYREDRTRLFYLEDIIQNSICIHKKGDLNNDLVDRRRNNSGSIAEGNAKSRSLGEIFPEIKRSFTLEELQIPILVGRVVVDTEDILSKNPELKSAYAVKLLDISNRTYNFPNNHLKNDKNEVAPAYRLYSNKSSPIKHPSNKNSNKIKTARIQNNLIHGMIDYPNFDNQNSILEIEGGKEFNNGGK